MATEVSHLGIRVLNAVPGGLRTSNWTKVNILPASPNAFLPPLYDQRNEEGTTSISSMVVGAPDDPRLKDYAPIRKKMFDFMANIPPTHVPGDSDKTAKAIIDTVCGNATNGEGKKLDWPDLNFLPLGPDAESDIRNKCERILKVLDEYKDVTRGIVVDDLQK